MKQYCEIISKYFKDAKSIPEFVDTFYPNENRSTKIRTIRRYCKGEVVPTYAAAKELLDVIGEKFEESKLIDILNYSDRNKEKERGLILTPFISKLSIQYKDMFQGIPMVPTQKDMAIRERIEATTESKSVKEYIIKLIENDIENQTLPDVGEEDKQ